MIYHPQAFNDPAKQVKEAKALLTFLLQNAPGNDTYRQTIERELNILNTTNDSYLYHEHLELENNQFYLHEFVDMATKSGLAYVGDTSLTTMYIGNFNKKVQETLSQIKDVVKQEQYIDFLINRRFRHSIITKKSNAAKIQRNLKPECVFDYHVQALFSASDTKADKTGKVKFTKTGTKEDFTANDALTCALFLKLSELGKKPVKLDDVIRAVVKEEKLKDDKAARQIFTKNTLILALQGFLALHIAPVNYASAPGKKPQAYALARYQAQQADTKRVTSLFKQSINIDVFTRKLLVLLDGRNDMGAIVKKLKDAVKAGELNVNRDGKPLTDDKDIEKILEQHTQATLGRLANVALLEA